MALWRRARVAGARQAQDSGESVIYKCIVIAVLAVMSSGCVPLLALGSASGAYGWWTDQDLKSRVEALEQRCGLRSSHSDQADQQARVQNK